MLAGESYKLGGDIVVEAGGTPVANLDRLRDIVAGKKPGDELDADDLPGRQEENDRA